MEYRELSAWADRVLEAGEDDEQRIAAALEALPPEIREELLVSDFLNAYQVFYYFFRIRPDLLVQERLTLAPASSLTRGIFLDESDLYELRFRLEENEPVIEVTDGEELLASFRGGGAYRAGLRYLEEGG